MKVVYRLEDELRNDPEQVRLAQVLTLDPLRPQIGLRGKWGLFGSPEWWGNIRSGVVPLRRVSGAISRMYVSGQDLAQKDNTFDLLCDDGSVLMESCYATEHKGEELYRVGARVEILYALDELKLQPADDGGVNYSDIVLEVAVSS